MLLENIALGRMIEIYVDREGYRYRLTSKVEETGKKKVCVTLIATNNKVFMFKPTDKVHVIYRDAEQLWEWTNVKASVAKFEGVLVHVFEIRNKGKSFNRRNAYRVAIGEEVLLGYYQKEDSHVKSSDIPYTEPEIVDGKEVIIDESELDKPEFVQGMIRDVSETGAGICTNFKFNIDDSMFFEMSSPYGKLKFKALVVRESQLRATNNKYANYYGCVFTQVDNRLIKYIFEIQREALKKQKEQQERERALREKMKAKLAERENDDDNEAESK